MAIETENPVEILGAFITYEFARNKKTLCGVIGLVMTADGEKYVILDKKDPSKSIEARFYVHTRDRLISRVHRKERIGIAELPSELGRTYTAAPWKDFRLTADELKDKTLSFVDAELLQQVRENIALGDQITLGNYPRLPDGKADYAGSYKFDGIKRTITAVFIMDFEIGNFRRVKLTARAHGERDAIKEIPIEPGRRIEMFKGILHART